MQLAGQFRCGGVADSHSGLPTVLGRSSSPQRMPDLAGPDAEARREIFPAPRCSPAPRLAFSDDENAVPTTARDQLLPGLAHQHPAYARITLRHLATMSEVIRGAARRQPGAALRSVYLDPQAPCYEAGVTACAYHDHDVYLLGQVLTRLARRSVEDIFLEPY